MEFHRILQLIIPVCDLSLVASEQLIEINLDKLTIRSFQTSRMRGGVARRKKCTL